MKKKILAAALAGIMTLGVAFTTQTQAATRDEIAAIKVSKSGKFNYWAKDSEAKQKLVEYVKDVTNKSSKNFIPIEDRIATFDMDGTILCETAPTAFCYMFGLYSILENPTPKVTETIQEKAKIWQEAVLTKKFTPEIENEFKDYGWKLFEGLTDEEYYSRLEKFMTTKNVVGLKNLKYGESFYLPMVEIISYLNANDFTVYIITGSERRATRGLLEGAVPVQKNHIIGCDIPYTWENNGGEKYFVSGDRILISDHRNGSNNRINKIYSINREIGKKPVLAFGNSFGDADMLNYTLTDNKYKSAAFMVICDDFDREIGNRELADSILQAAQKNNWNTISMKNDWTTIYGDNVKVIK